MTNPAYFKGLMPVDWGVNEAVPFKLLEPALQTDTTEGKASPPAHNRALLDPGRCHLEIIIAYTSFGPALDRTKISSYVTLTLPTSRGSLSISSTSPTDSPSIDPNDCATNADSVALIHGTRRLMQALLDISAGRAYIERSFHRQGSRPWIPVRLMQRSMRESELQEPRTNTLEAPLLWPGGGY
jgi:hypothetical protein